MRKDDLLRYQLIEVILLWEGRLTARHLTDYFSISRPSAQKSITDYKELNPTAFARNNSEKGHIAVAGFEPLFISSDFAQYQQFFAAQPESDSPLHFAIELLPVPLRNVTPEWVRPILLAIKQSLRLDIGYLSLSSPDYEDRIIQPHSIVFDGFRYHVRGFCEKNQDFRDFVLSRFNGEFVFEGAATHTAADDLLWQTWLDVVICPDQRLALKQRQCIEFDYQMQDGKKVIRTRAALLNYLLQRLRVDIYQTDAQSQQIIIEPECRKALSPYLNR
ncbi:WYL domain-containing protein [Pseudoalteromonas tunicata]|nr:WYL domain-containing protein [Pseudoalteromonas tunicata]AXT33474.1 WYL domain-containing protein [Pseudoalteromonas tunicata]MDP4984155.1 WYL domain-containing protein [Pseudoalteromonas tunicata]MDP5214457.1 WYL domain-containing protein [Pseudoalteromonas tunicata]